MSFFYVLVQLLEYCFAALRSYEKRTAKWPGQNAAFLTQLWGGVLSVAAAFCTCYRSGGGGRRPFQIESISRRKNYSAEDVVRAAAFRGAPSASRTGSRI